ncbi:ATP-binding protein [soil metagenome]
MYLIEVYKLIEEGENSHTEFKRKFSTPEKIAKEMIAFANSGGGKIIFGVDDDKTIVGIESEKEEFELVNTAAKFYCEPEIEFTTDIICIKNKDLLVIDVPESSVKPHFLLVEKEEPKAFIRHKDQSILASKETVKILRNSVNDDIPLTLYIGDIEKSLFAFLEMNDRITVKGFKKLVNISERRASRTLINLVRANLIRHHFMGREDFFTLI